MRKFIISTGIAVVLGLGLGTYASAQYIDYYGQMSYSNRYPLPLPGNPANPYLNWPNGGPYYNSYYVPTYGVNYGYGPYYPRYYYPYAYGYSMYQPYGGITYYRTY